MAVILDHALSEFFQKYPDISAQDKLGIGVSGGPDSMALAAALINYFKTDSAKEIYIISVDHGLRADAATEIKMVQDWAKSQNINHQTLLWQGDKPDTGVMAAARQARYDLMNNFCLEENIQTLFIAHHADDQAETFLIRLAKGSGLDGLAAMSDWRVNTGGINIARPFLNVPKQILVEYCEAKNVPFMHDPSNENEQYLRPRLRQSMEALAAEGLTPKRLTITAKRLSRARKALERLAAKAFDEAVKQQQSHQIILDYEVLRAHPEEIGLRVVQNAIADLRCGALYQVRMEKLEELFEWLWFDPKSFKPRTLGGLKFSLKKIDINSGLSLIIEREKL